MTQIPETGKAVDVESIEFHSADGVFVKSMGPMPKDTLVCQHSHEYEHMSMLATGSVRVWCDGEHLGDFRAPNAIHIKERKKHAFLTLEDNTLVYCIHNVSRTGDVEIAERHELRR